MNVYAYAAAKPYVLRGVNQYSFELYIHIQHNDTSYFFCGFIIYVLSLSFFSQNLEENYSFLRPN